MAIAPAHAAGLAQALQDFSFSVFIFRAVVAGARARAEGGGKKSLADTVADTSDVAAIHGETKSTRATVPVLAPVVTSTAAIPRVCAGVGRDGEARVQASKQRLEAKLGASLAPHARISGRGPPLTQTDYTAVATIQHWPWLAPPAVAAQLRTTGFARLLLLFKHSSPVVSASHVHACARTTWHAHRARSCTRGARAKARVRVRTADAPVAAAALSWTSASLPGAHPQLSPFQEVGKTPSCPAAFSVLSDATTPPPPHVKSLTQ